MTFFMLCLVLLWLIGPGWCTSQQFSWLGLMPMQVTGSDFSHVVTVLHIYCYTVAVLYILLGLMPMQVSGSDFAHFNAVIHIDYYCYTVTVLYILLWLMPLQALDYDFSHFITVMHILLLVYCHWHAVTALYFMLGSCLRGHLSPASLIAFALTLAVSHGMDPACSYRLHHIGVRNSTMPGKHSAPGSMMLMPTTLWTVVCHCWLSLCHCWPSLCDCSVPSAVLKLAWLEWVG